MSQFSSPGDKVIQCSSIYFRDALTTRRWGGHTVRDRIDSTMAKSIEVNLTWRTFRAVCLNPDSIPVEGPLESVKQWDRLEEEASPEVAARPRRGRPASAA